MGRRGSGKSKKNRSGTKTRRRRSTRANKQSKPSLGKLVATGVRSIMASVPAVGGALAAISDIAFKTFGITSSGITHEHFQNADTRIVSLVARFHLSLVCFIAGSRDVIQMDSGRRLACQYRDGRLRSATIRILPSNEVSKRQGFISFGIQPFFSSDDAKNMKVTSDSRPVEQQIKHMYLSTTGPASRPLSLTYTPRMEDGWAYQFKALDQLVMEVAIYFHDMNRDVVGAFTAADFNCQIIASGSVDMRTCPSSLANNAGPYIYTSVCDDILKPVSLFLYSSKDEKSYALTDATFTSSDTKCTVSGTLLGSTGYSQQSGSCTGEGFEMC